MDINEIVNLVVKLVVVVISGLISTHLIPYLKSKYTVEQLNRTFEIIDAFVAGAEQIANNLGYDGAWKKAHVEEQLMKKGITITEEINDYIEAAVIMLHNELISVGDIGQVQVMDIEKTE